PGARPPVQAGPRDRRLPAVDARTVKRDPAERCRIVLPRSERDREGRQLRGHRGVAAEPRPRASHRQTADAVALSGAARGRGGRESGAIEQDADIVILLHRDDMYEIESPRAGELDLIVAKNRSGMRATVTLGFDGKRQRILQMATEYQRSLEPAGNRGNS